VYVVCVFFIYGCGVVQRHRFVICCFIKDRLAEISLLNFIDMSSASLSVV